MNHSVSDRPNIARANATQLSQGSHGTATLDSTASTLSRLFGSELIRLVAVLIGLLVIHAVAWNSYYVLCYRGTQESFYFGSIIFVRAFQHPLFMAALAATLAVPVLFWSRVSWTSFAEGRKLRWFIGFLVLLATWKFTAYDFNWYFNQAHLVDRALLVVLAVGVVWNPSMLPAFLLAMFIVMGQFVHPFGFYSGTDKRMLLDVLIMFSAVTVVKGLGWVPIRWKDREVREDTLFVFCMLCLIGSFYLFPAIAKLLLSPHGYEWITQNDHGYILARKVERGWLSFLDPSTVESTVKTVTSLGLVIGVGGIVTEAFGLLMLAGRRICMFCLLSFIVLHGLIYLTSGILFWEWMCVDVALIVLLACLTRESVQLIFNRRMLAASLIVMAAAPIYFRPVGLGWFDTKLDNFTLVEGVGESGQVYELANVFLSPYSLTFEQERFLFPLDEKFTSQGSSAIHNYQAFQEINAASMEEISAVKDKWGRNYHDPEKTAALDRFLRTYFKNLNSGESNEFWFGRFQSPPHHPGTHLPTQLARHDELPEDLAEVRIRLVETFYEGLTPHVFRNEVIHRVEIDQAALDGFRVLSQ